jgi:hypothetical protein
VQLAISDAHAGLKAAIAKVLGCAWQRCTVHFLRDCLGHARKGQHGLLAALIRPIFNADGRAQARDRLSEAVAHLDGRLAKVASLLEDAEADILAFYAFPAAHWRKLRSTNPLERFNREVGRRTDVVRNLPDHRRLIRQLQDEQAIRRNREEGFWIAEADPRAAHHAIVATVTSPWAVLATDGAYQPLQYLGLDDWRRLSRCPGSGLADALRKCHEWERSDMDGMRQPRSKGHDDKTIASARC